MTRHLSLAAFALGAIVVIWMGSSFVGNNLLALVVTVMIAAVFLLGFVELMRFQHETSTLESTLAELSEPPSQLESWIAALPAGLHNAVRRRVQDGQAGLPAPVLTPYLVGLLVMLGLLGTFIGMVETLRGAVTALEGSNELEAIRAGLAQPIQGLGMAFATSVAGVTTSAMLGFISTLSRKQRIAVSWLLDEKIRGVLAGFSNARHRQQTFDAIQSQATALQAQAAALPEVAGSLASLVERLDAMALQLRQDSERVSAGIVDSQTTFHKSIEDNYQGLARSVETSLKASLAESGRLAGESIEPVISEVMKGIARQAETTHGDLRSLAQAQVDALTAQYGQHIDQLSEVWKTAFADQKQNGLETLAQFEQHSAALRNQFAELANTALEKMQSSQSAHLQRLQEQDLARGEQWNDALGQVDQVLRHSADELTAGARSSAAAVTEKIAGLLASTEALLEARAATEAQWQLGFEARVGTLAETVAQEMTKAADAEAARGQAAVDRLAALESAVATQLASLGNALEAPMSRLIETASEAPRAAAELIATLQTEMSKTIERDKGLLEERAGILTDLNSLSESLAESSRLQQETVEKMLASTGESLAAVTEQFNLRVGEGVSTLAEVVDNFSSSAVELNSLGDAFTEAVSQFGEANDKLMARLEAIEQTLVKSTDRSDEQMAYYVAQAREIIDSNMLSQQEIMAQIQQLALQRRTTEQEA